MDEEPYLVDYSTPVLDILNDGPLQDIDTFTTATIEANWSVIDDHSDITGYAFAIGTLPSLDDIEPWTSNGLNGSISNLLSSPIYNQV